MKIPRSILCLLVLLPVSCASDGGKSKDPATPAAHKSLNERLNENNGYKQDANGNWLPQNDKRSPFENQGKSAYFQGQYSKKAYKTGDYSKKSWWGDKDYGTRQYAGGTDGSRFQKSSAFDGQGAREAATSANIPNHYQTGGYATGAARESANSPIAKPYDDETDNRRKSYQAPEVIDWREQRSLSLDQSRGILGH